MTTDRIKEIQSKTAYPNSVSVQQALLQVWNETEQEQLCQHFVSGSAIKPPLGLIPKKFHDERIKVKRFNEVRGAIARYYDAGMKINIEWIEEYNELVEYVLKLK